MSFFERAFGGSHDSENKDSYERPIHSRFTIMEDGTQGNILFRSEHPEKLTGKDSRPYFIFAFDNATVLDIFDERDHPVLIERFGEGYKAKVWCEKKLGGSDLATMEEMVKQNGGTILDEEDPEEDKNEQYHEVA